MVDPADLHSELGTKIFGRNIVSLDTVGSTNDLAKHLARSNAPPGTLVLARIQRGGKGRLNRTWHSPEGGIYMSLILRPRVPPSIVPGLSLVAGHAVAGTIRDHLNLPALIKWPNDVHIGRNKVSGILCEMGVLNDSQTLFVVLGIGVNGNTDPGDLPEGATSLKAQLGRPVGASTLAARTLERLELFYEQFVQEGLSNLVRDMNRHLLYLNELVILKRAGAPSQENITGTFLGIDLKGRAVIRTKGKLERFLAGDLSLRGC